MTFAARQQRVRVLEALEQRVKQFLRREDLWPLRVPREPLLLADVVRQALPGEHALFDAATLKTRTLLSLEWEDGSRWEAWMAALPSGLKLYCDSSELCGEPSQPYGQSEEDEQRVLASGGRNEGDESDRVFLQLLAESGGRHFGIEMSGGAPRSVRSPLEHAFLVDRFVDLFEVSGTEQSVIDQLPGGQSGRSAEGHDFRADVDAWLTVALRRRSVMAAKDGRAGDLGRGMA